MTQFIKNGYLGFEDRTKVAVSLFCLLQRVSQFDSVFHGFFNHRLKIGNQVGLDLGRGLQLKSVT